MKQISSHSLFFIVFVFKDFTRLKLVQGKKEDDLKENIPVKNSGKDNDITANFDAQDDADVVF